MRLGLWLKGVTAIMVAVAAILIAIGVAPYWDSMEEYSHSLNAFQNTLLVVPIGVVLLGFFWLLMCMGFIMIPAFILSIFSSDSEVRLS
ncbi:MAG: hypothetical protein ABIT47_02250 [Candidatus Paceibacterota bacterium]